MYVSEFSAIFNLLQIGQQKASCHVAVPVIPYLERERAGSLSALNVLCQTVAPRKDGVFACWLGSLEVA